MRNEELSGTTPVPNIFFDAHLKSLNPVELKLLLLIIRQTWGWKDPKTGQRKKRDWIAGSQIRERTGCSRRALTDAVANLTRTGLIEVTGEKGVLLKTPDDRKGKMRLFYRYRCGKGGDTEMRGADFAHVPAQQMRTTKETYTKTSDDLREKTIRFTEHDLEQFGKDLQQAGTIEQLLIEKEAVRYREGEMNIMIHADGTKYVRKHLSAYSIPGLNQKGLRTPYSIWMTLYHRYRSIQENSKPDTEITRKDHENV